MRRTRYLNKSAFILKLTMVIDQSGMQFGLNLLYYIHFEIEKFIRSVTGFFASTNVLLIQ